MTSSWEKFGILMWKNYLTKRRRWISTLPEMIFPIIIIILMIFLAKGLGAHRDFDAKKYWESDPDSLCSE
jgi:hypothetical protein